MPTSEGAPPARRRLRAGARRLAAQQRRQGSMLIAKTRREPQMIVDNLELVRAYVDALFTAPRAARSA